MRAKIILPNLLAVLAVGLVGYFYLKCDLTAKAKDRLTSRLDVSAKLFNRSEALAGFELLNDVRNQAMTKDVTEAFATVEIAPAEGETEDQHQQRIRQAWFKAGVKSVEMYSELWLERSGKKPELVFLTDRNGVVIARNTTANACPTGYNVSKAIPVVAKALDGESSYALWSVDDSAFGSAAGKDEKSCALINSGLIEMASAPVWVGDAIAGTLVIGFEVSNGTAAKKSRELGTDVAVLAGGHVYSSSFTTDTARQSLDKELSSTHADKVSAALGSGRSSDVFELSIEGASYLAIVSPVVNSEKKDRVANVVFGSISDAADEVGALVFLLALMGAACVFVIVVGALLGGHFLKPVMAIEEGLLKVINGEYDYRFEVESAEVGGLSYRINQLIGVLTGEEEEGEEE